MKKMKSRYKGWCRACTKDFKVGDWIYWNPDTKEVRHRKCLNAKKREAKNAGVCLPGRKARFVTGR